MTKEKTDKKQNKTPNYVAMESTLGAVCLLLTKSPSYKYIFSHEYEWRIIPAIVAKQFSLFRNDKGEPIAFVSFASVNDEVEKRLLEGSLKLIPQDWTSGSKLYIIDVVSPFVPILDILTQLNNGQFKNKNIKVLKPSKEGKSVTAISLESAVKDIKSNKINPRNK